MVPIRDWKTTVEEHAVMIEQYQTFSQLAGLLSGLVAEKPGMFVYSGTLLEGVEKEMRVEVHTDTMRYLKTCPREPYSGDYAAACASSLENLVGFDPEVGHGLPFTLGWFPADDPIAPEIVRGYNQWPDATNESFLPAGPSLSTRSVELTGLGEDMAVIGLFIQDSCKPDLLPYRLREILGKDAVIAGVDVEDFWHWLEWDFSFDALMPIDCPLPFSI